MPTGLLRFLVPPSCGLTDSLAQRAYMAGLDLIPWPCRVRLESGYLLVERPVTDSGKFHIPWPVEGHGEVMLCTGTLMEREGHYDLAVELARGKVNQVRNQIAEWQSIGLVVPAKVEVTLRRALEHLSVAATTQHIPQSAEGRARQAIVAAVDAGDLLVSGYTEQALASRHRHAPRLRTLLGCQLGKHLLDPAAAAGFLKAFNAAAVPMDWREVEAAEGYQQWEVSDRHLDWCEANGINAVSGPLVRLDRLALPDWLCLWEGDFDNVQAFMTDFVGAAVKRYRGRVHAWHCAARMNLPDVLSLTEEQRLRLTVRAIEVARQIDPKTPLVISLDQPWAEYMSRTAPDLSPLHFADALVRGGLDLAAVGLEINMGYQPGSYPRDRLEFSRLLDLWSLLGLPLHLLLTVPGGASGGRKEGAARSQPNPIEGGMQGGWSPENQAAWVKHYLPTMLAKPSVQAIFWNQFEEEADSQFPQGGLFDRATGPKPALAALAGVRKKHLE